MSQPKKAAFCTMSADWSICCTSKKEKALGVHHPLCGCQCSQSPKKFNVYVMIPLVKPTKKAK
jgi:hypothetical protein